jgi:hypothetical protein
MSFDGLPTTTYAYGDTYTTSDNDDVHCITNPFLLEVGQSINTNAGAAYGGLCREVWELAVPSSACVRFEGSLQRNFDTGDTTSDIVLTYREYTMHA